MNRDYLEHDWPTDVISFALHELGDPVLGDVYIGHEVAYRQATERDIDMDEELVRLAIHGTLHVLGLEHPEGPDRESAPIYEIQEALVRTVMEAR